jgi:hypothetical protein
MTVTEKILKLTRQFYPTGRAFKMPFDSWLESSHRGLAADEKEAFEAAVSTLYSIIPDNDSFTEDDATDWERRLGLITNESVSLEDRKLAIRRKMASPGRVKPRQSATWLQKQLRDAGFDVYVYENLSGLPPEDVAVGDFITDSNYGQFNYGEFNYGGYYNNIIANYIDEEKEIGFDPGTTLKFTFFIGGSTLGAFADVDEERKDEFRQTILRVKPAQTAGFLFINYI